MTSLRLAAHRCDQCLTTRKRIVPGARAAAIVKACRRSNNHFFCHKDAETHCRGVHDILARENGGSNAYQLATRLGIPVEEVDPSTLQD